MQGYGYTRQVFYGQCSAAGPRRAVRVRHRHRSSRSRSGTSRTVEAGGEW